MTPEVLAVSSAAVAAAVEPDVDLSDTSVTKFWCRFAIYGGGGGEGSICFTAHPLWIPWKSWRVVPNKWTLRTGKNFCNIPGRFLSFRPGIPVPYSIEDTPQVVFRWWDSSQYLQVLYIPTLFSLTTFSGAYLRLIWLLTDLVQLGLKSQVWTFTFYVLLKFFAYQCGFPWLT